MTTGQILDGIRILDVGHILAGPFISGILGDFGADVIHIESPETGDYLRLIMGVDSAPTPRGDDLINRNKRNITLNMATSEGRELFHRLVAISDVVTENFRPGVMERWGHNWETLHGINPRLVYCRMSGFGQTGPYRGRRAYGRIAEGFGGWAYTNGHPDSTILHSGFSFGDTLHSLWAAVSIIGVLYWRDAQGGGEGQLIDVGLFEPLFRLLEQQIIIYDQHQANIERFGTQHEATPYAGVSQTADDRFFSWSAPTQATIEALLAVLGLSGDPRFNEFLNCMQHRDEFQAAADGWMRQHTADEVFAVFDEHDAVGSPVMSAIEWKDDPHIRARDMLVAVNDPEGGDPIQMQGVVPKLSKTPGRIDHANEPLGARNEEVYCGLLGLEQTDLERLRSTGVI